MATESQSHRHPRALSIQVGEIFLCLISTNSPTRYAHRGIIMLCKKTVNKHWFSDMLLCNILAKGLKWLWFELIFRQIFWYWVTQIIVYSLKTLDDLNIRTCSEVFLRSTSNSFTSISTSAPVVSCHIGPLKTNY